MDKYLLYNPILLSTWHRAAAASFDIHPKFSWDDCVSDGGKRHATITDTLLYMIAVDCLPLSLTQRKGFKKFVKVLQPLYHPPCSTTITTMMEQKYKVLQAKIKTLLNNKKNLLLTTDLWTESMTTKSGLTAHYLEDMLILFFVINLL